MSAPLAAVAPDLDAAGAAAVYLVVIGFVFVECALLVGFLLPGDTLLFAGGLVAADAGRDVSVGWLTLGVFAAAVVGECVGYVLGARMGYAVLRRGRGRILTPRRVERAERFTARYGVLAVIAARWIPWVRTFAPLLAGATRMPWPTFLLANVVGALCWAPALVLLGYLAADAPGGHDAALVAAAAVVGVALVGAAVRCWSTVRNGTDSEAG